MRLCYDEIAQIVGKTEVNCRRYYHRAKEFLVERRPRFEPTSNGQHRLLQGFLQAVSVGDVDSLTKMLAEDVMIYGDGGGKQFASPRPIVGRELVQRLLFGLYKMIPDDVHIEIADVNNAPSVIMRGPSGVLVVMNFVIVDRQVMPINNVLNPDKLAYLSQRHS